MSKREVFRTKEAGADGDAPEKLAKKDLAFAGVAKAVGDREVEVVISTKEVDRDEDIVEPRGIDLKNYNRNPIVLFQHDRGQPVAKTVKLDLYETRMVALAKFPAAGTVTDSDRVYGMIKEEIINAASIGFMPKAGQWELRDPEKPWGGRHYKAVELIEWSFVSIPANPGAVIIGRSFGLETGKVFSWGGENGFRMGRLKSIGAEEVEVEMLDYASGAVTGETVKMARAEAEASFTPREIEVPEPTAEDESDCSKGEGARIAAEARLRAVNALRLRLI